MIIRRECCKINGHDVTGLNWNLEWNWVNNTTLKSLFDTKVDNFESVKRSRLKYVCRQLVAIKTYESAKDVKKAIDNGDLIVHFTVSFTDMDKLYYGSSVPNEELETKSRRQVFDELCTTVEYEWYSNENSNIVRNEIYGFSTGYSSGSVRFELNDYTGYEPSYKFGDIVAFKNPIDGCKAGIVIFGPNSDSEMECPEYDVDLLNRRFKPNNKLFGVTGVHENDIAMRVGRSVRAARESLEMHKYHYDDEYVKTMLGEK